MDNIKIAVKNVQQTAGGAGEEISFAGTGKLYMKKDKLYLVYRDHSEGVGGARTTLKIDPAEKRVLLTRTEPAKMSQEFIAGEEIEGSYQTRAGRFSLKVKTSRLKIIAGERQGELEIKYALYLNQQLTAYNNLYISYRKLRKDDDE